MSQPKEKQDLEIKEGMFIRHSGCSIFFEVKSVLDHSELQTLVVCASIDPKKNTNLVYLNDVCEVLTFDQIKTEKWPKYIKLDRTKNFYDKFYPEGWQGSVMRQTPFNLLKENDLVVTEKGLCKLKQKKTEHKWTCIGGKKSLSSKFNKQFCVLVQLEKFIGIPT